MAFRNIPQIATIWDYAIENRNDLCDVGLFANRAPCSIGETSAEQAPPTLVDKHVTNQKYHVQVRLHPRQNFLTVRHQNTICLKTFSAKYD
jgi:hypothetical protein